MAMSWEGRARLQRLTGIADELLTATRVGAGEAPLVQRELDFLMNEIHMVLALDAPDVAGEFDHVVRAREELPPQLRAAELAGWLKAQLAVESAAAQRAALLPPPERRKHTLGFKIRSPIEREATPPEPPQQSG